jgi:hypothetical protein
MKNLLFGFLLFISCQSLSQNYRPELFFREDWKEIPAEIPANQNHISNEDLQLSTYGMGKDSLKKSHHDAPVDDPYYLWSGLCLDTWAVTFKHKEYYADLSSFAKIKWRTKQAGFRQLRIILKLANGQWLISDKFDGPSSDWRISEFNISDIQWWQLDIESIVEIKPASPDELDLSKVDEIGFTDLMKGGKSNACSRLDWIEVYATKMPRE